LGDEEKVQYRELRGLMVVIGWQIYFPVTFGFKQDYTGRWVVLNYFVFKNIMLIAASQHLDICSWWPIAIYKVLFSRKLIV
jgi:hypothetical protein